MSSYRLVSIVVFSLLFSACGRQTVTPVKEDTNNPPTVAVKPKKEIIPFNPRNLVSAAKERTKHKVTYDGRYIPIRYPMGDVPNHIGVCTDVVVRAYRRLGIDLQRNIHEDMKRRFHEYPSQRVWGKLLPDPNIDHRRVLNMEAYFEKYGKKIPVTYNAKDYIPGDLVTWRIGGIAPHIGIVVDKKSEDGERYLIVHNDGKGPVVEDILFDNGLKLVGHYRYWPAKVKYIK